VLGRGGGGRWGALGGGQEEAAAAAAVPGVLGALGSVDWPVSNS
jgi:hypothetical protein